VFGKLILDIGVEIGVRIVILFVALAVALLFVHWIVRHLYSYLQARTEDITVFILRWCGRHPLLGKYTATLFEPDTPAYKALVASASILFITVLLFIVAVGFAIGHVNDGSIVSTVNQFLLSLRDPVGDKFMVFVTMMADYKVLVPVLLSVIVWFAIKRHYSAIIHLLFAVVITAIMIHLFKFIIGAPRPLSHIHDVAASSYSFPSGHATMAMAVYGFVTILIANGMSTRWRSIPYLTTTLIVTMVGLSRMYLGEHWLTDVFGGILLALIWLSLTGISYQRHLHRTYQSGSLVVTVLLTAIVAIVVNHHLYFDKEYKLARSRIPYPQTSIAASDWWQNGWRNLSTYRNDLRQVKDHPLNIQYTGPLKPLREKLTKAGWKKPIKMTALSSVRWLHTTPTLEQLPTIPHVHKARHEVLLLTKQNKKAKTQYVIRLWRADYRLEPEKQALYVGNVSSQSIQNSFYLFNYPVTNTDFLGPAKTLLNDIKGFTIKQEKRKNVVTSKRTRWDGSVILIKN
jgi:undecaprenyl-diphosphatase